MNYLLDTNVVSELRKGPQANVGVRQWIAKTAADCIYLPAIAIAEISYGVAKAAHSGDRQFARLLDVWLDDVLNKYKNRILPFNEDAALKWGPINVPDMKKARDSMIAAIALSEKLVVVTRDVEDYQGTGAKVLNPFA